VTDSAPAPAAVAAPGPLVARWLCTCGRFGLEGWVYVTVCFAKQWKGLLRCRHFASHRILRCFYLLPSLEDVRTLFRERITVSALFALVSLACRARVRDNSIGSLRDVTRKQKVGSVRCLTIFVLGIGAHSSFLGGEKHLPWIVASVSQAYALMRCALNPIN